MTLKLEMVNNQVWPCRIGCDSEPGDSQLLSITSGAQKWARCLNHKNDHGKYM